MSSPCLQTFLSAFLVFFLRFSFLICHWAVFCSIKDRVIKKHDVMRSDTASHISSCPDTYSKPLSCIYLLFTGVLLVCQTKRSCVLILIYFEGVYCVLCWWSIKTTIQILCVFVMHDTFTNSQSSHLFQFSLWFKWDTCALKFEPVNHGFLVLLSRWINSPALHSHFLFQDAELRTEMVASSGNKCTRIKQ